MFTILTQRLAIVMIIPFILFGIALDAQTIAEKKAGVAPTGSDLSRDMQKVLLQINKELLEDQAELKTLYAEVMTLYDSNAPEDKYKDLLERINYVKAEIVMLEQNWREMAILAGAHESYALWHQPDSNVGQLIIDYGSQNYVYIVPPEIAAIKVSVDSNIPIPRSSWGEMMELILAQNGVGFRQLNPYLRQLYLIKQDRSGIALITNNRKDLEVFPPDVRIAFVLSPEPYEVRRIWSFMDKFTNPNTLLQMVGRDILIVAPAPEIIDLLKLYDFVSANSGDKEYKIRSLTKVDAEEMAKILGVIFDHVVESAPPEKPSSYRSSQQGKTLVDLKPQGRDLSKEGGEVNGLRVIPLKAIAQAVFLIGTAEEIRKAEEIVDQVEQHVGEAREKVIFWYTTKHSDPEELAQILDKIYNLMVMTNTGVEQYFPDQGQGWGQNQEYPYMVQRLMPRYGSGGQSPLTSPGQLLPMAPQQVDEMLKFATTAPPDYVTRPLSSPPPNPLLPSKLYQNDFYQQGGYAVNPAPVEPGVRPEQRPNWGRDNFIVDLKTGSLVMVVEADILPKMKEVIKKLDVPKKMVQIEALVFEKTMARQDNFGLNLLRIGDVASNKDFWGVLWNNITAPTDLIPNPPDNTGIFDFILSKPQRGRGPAFDLMYRFLIHQEDITINANPTVVTVNQTPAKIAIVQEISVNTGIFLVDTVKGITPENAFTRAQYGITIVVTPTIHWLADDKDPFSDATNYVTLDTDITFDTFQPSTNQQPNVTRRKVTNQVRIPDGQTVIIGGLRRKNADDVKDSIPFLGEIPGFGKLFSESSMADNTLELYILLTPKIIADPCEDFEKIKYIETLRRPGDIPEFLCRVRDAQEAEKDRLYAGTMNIIFGRPLDRCTPEWYSNDVWNSIDLDPCPMGDYDGR